MLRPPMGVDPVKSMTSELVPAFWTYILNVSIPKLH